MFTASQIRCSFTSPSKSAAGRSTVPRSLPSVPYFFAVAMSLRVPRGLDAANEDHAVRSAGHRAPHPEEMLFRVDAEHVQVLHRDARAAHAARQALPLDDAARIGGGADRAGLLVRGDAVRLASRGEVVPPDHAGETATLGDADHVHLASHREDGDRDLLPRLICRDVVHLDLTKDARHGFAAMLLHVPLLGLRHALLAL